jgi:hypothetical protein
MATAAETSAAILATLGDPGTYTPLWLKFDPDVRPMVQTGFPPASLEYIFTKYKEIGSPLTKRKYLYQAFAFLFRYPVGRMLKDRRGEMRRNWKVIEHLSDSMVDMAEQFKARGRPANDIPWTFIPNTRVIGHEDAFPIVIQKPEVFQRR